jgi:3-hydroxyisobutyrate dehydrogenase
MSEQNTFCVTVLGLGAMGSRMAASLLKAGHQVIVWNRSAEPAHALQASGAIVAATPREATQNAAFVIAMVRDDHASRTVWTDPEIGALAGMRSDAIAIESSTLTPTWTRELGQICEARGLAFLEAPVAGSRPQADAGQLIYFVGGQKATVQRAEPVLKAMGASIHHAGLIGDAALVKLVINAMFGLQVAGLAELLGMARNAGADVGKLLEIFCATPVASPAVKVAGGAMLAGNFAPMFPIELVEKDLDYVLQASRQVNSFMPLVQAVHHVLIEAAKNGLSESNITSLASLY